LSRKLVKKNRRKDEKKFFFGFSNLEKIRQEAVWSDELERWKIPDLVIARTKLPPAGNCPLHEIIFKC